MPPANDPRDFDFAARFSSYRARVTVLAELTEVLPGAVGRWYIYSAKTLHIIVTLGSMFGRVQGGDLDEHYTYLGVPGSNSRRFWDDSPVSAPDPHPRLPSSR